jgi:hypothetical protein
MIEIQQLTKVYGDKTAVDDLTFTVRRSSLTRRPIGGHGTDALDASEARFWHSLSRWRRSVVDLRGGVDKTIRVQSGCCLTSDLAPDRRGGGGATGLLH